MKILKFTSLIILMVALSGCASDATLEDVVTENSSLDSSIDLEVVDVSSNDYGSVGALEDGEFTIEEMLVYALEDEYAARAEYDYILNSFDVTNPFSNIIKSEETHIALLLPLFDTYDLEVPEDTSSEHLITIDSLTETYETGVLAEEYNIAMYDLFLDQDNLPLDLIDAFTKLRDASLNHLAAFQRNADKI